MFALVAHTGTILDLGPEPVLEPDGRYAYPASEGDLMCDVYPTREEARAARDHLSEMAELDRYYPWKGSR